MEKCTTHKKKELGYMQWMADADRRDKKGQKQVQCPICQYWFWKDEFGKGLKAALNNASQPHLK